MKHFLLISLCLLLISSAYSQNPWTEIHSVSGVKVYSKTVHCNYNQGFDEERVLLKFENTTSADVTVDWDYVLHINGSCSTCNSSQEYHRTLSIPANSLKEGACGQHADDRLSLFSKFDDPNYSSATSTGYVVSELTKFELTNLTITND